MNNFSLSEKGLKQLIAREGSKNRMYHDVAGLPTIGVGHLLKKSELTSGKIMINCQPVKWWQGLTDSEIESLLLTDVERFEDAINKFVKVELTQSQFDTLVSFSFNVGIGAFRSSTLLKKLNRGDYDSVPEQLNRWVYSGGRKIKGLIYRRKSEIEQWLA